MALSELAGVIPALVTPRCDGKDEPDLSGLRRVVEWLLGCGVHGIFPGSSTGEAPLLSWKQRLAVIETVAEAVHGSVPVLGGVGAASTAESLRLSRDAETAGATHLAVLPMHFVRVTQDELYGYFAAIADSSSLPVLLYNFPDRTSGQDISPTTAARLAKSHNVVGMKDSSGDLTHMARCLAECGEGFGLFTGSESLLYPLLLLGGHGTICGGANVLPNEIVSLYNTASAGNHQSACEMQRRLLPWREASREGTFPAAVKAAMAMVGQNVGAPFLPVSPLNEEQLRQVRYQLAQITSLP